MDIHKKIDLIITRYHSGDTATDIAERFGIARTTVREILRLAGVDRRGPRSKADRNAKIVGSYRAGFTLAELAKSHNLCLERVRQIIIRGAPGIMRKPGGESRV